MIYVVIYFVTSAGFTKVGYSKNPQKRYREAIVPPKSDLRFIGEGDRWVEGNIHYLMLDRWIEREWFQDEVTLAECEALHAAAVTMGDVGHRTLGQATSEQKRIAGRKGAAKPRSLAHREATSRAMRRLAADRKQQLSA